MKDCVKNFTERGRKESDWVFVTVVRLAQTQEERVENGEISPPKLRNYVKAVKMFCEMNDIAITWKRIIEYSNRRIEPVVYTILSSVCTLRQRIICAWPISSNRTRRQNRCCKNDYLCR